MNRDLAALKAALSRAVEWGLLSANPVARMKRLTEDESAIVRYLSADEEIRLREALARRDARRQAARVAANAWRRDRGYELWPEYGVYTDHLTPLVLLALNTGLRRGELFQLRWHDVELTPGLLTVRGAGAKSGQTRHLPLNSEAVRTLEHWKARNAGPRDLVFAGASGTEPLDNIKRAWTGVMTMAKISAFRFHDLRHTFASKLVMAGVDLNTVRELLGHSDIAMTLRYTHLAPQHKASAVEKLVSSVAR
jgi:integrase